MVGRAVAMWLHLLFLLACRTGALTSHSRADPGAVAKLFAGIEASWLKKAGDELNGTSSDMDTLQAVEGSCIKIARSVLDGAEGYKDRVASYMHDVCDLVPSGDQANLCREFSSGITAFMSPDEQYNHGLKLWKFCDNFFATSVTQFAVYSDPAVKDAPRGRQRDIFDDMLWRVTKASESLHAGELHDAKTSGAKAAVNSGSSARADASNTLVDAANSKAGAFAAASMGLPSWRLPKSLQVSGATTSNFMAASRRAEASLALGDDGKPVPPMQL